MQGYAPAGTLALAIDGGLQVQGQPRRARRLDRPQPDEATSVGGFAGAAAGGLENEAQTTLVGTYVAWNSVTANGAFGVARGGGISNFNLTGDPNDPPDLKPLNSLIIGNTVQASPGIAPVGGGVWTDTPVQFVRTLLFGNRPDQCSGC